MPDIIELKKTIGIYEEPQPANKAFINCVSYDPETGHCKRVGYIPRSYVYGNHDFGVIVELSDVTDKADPHTDERGICQFLSEQKHGNHNVFFCRKALKNATA